MSILNVNQIQPVGSGQTVTISATNIDTGSATFTGGSVGIGTDNPGASLDVVSNSSAEGIRVRGRSSDSIGSLYFYNHTSATPYGLVQGRSTDFRLGSESNTPVIFIVNGSEVARFNTSGNLAFPSGQGIDFSATADGSGTATSELLDDYEEGSWTPDVSGGGVSWNNRSGSYVKIGKQVIAQFWLQASSTSSTSGTFSINGLPYTSGVYNDRPCGACRAYGLTNFTGKSGVLYWMSGNVAYVNIVAVDGNGLTEGTSLNHNVWQNGAEIHCSIQYQTA